MGRRPGKLDFRRKVHKPKKQMLFCLSADPAASAYLASLLSLCPKVAVAHETPPGREFDMADIARKSRIAPDAAVEWWRDVLKFVDKLPHPYFALTTHLFATGPGDVLLDMKVVPDVIRVTRPPRDIALWMWRRGWVPAETADGYTLHPDNPKHLALPNWSRYNAYQLCYWYALEMEARIEALAKRIADADGKVFVTNIENLSERAGLAKMVSKLDLPEPDWKRLTGKQYDDGLPDALRDRLPSGDPEELEQAVRDALVPAEEWEDTGPTKVDVVVLAKKEINRDLFIALVRMLHRMPYKMSVAPAWGNPTSSNRNEIAREFRWSEKRAEWLMMIDYDTIPDGDFLSVIESDADVIVFPAPCWQPIKSPNEPIVWNVQMDDRATTYTVGRTMAELAKEGPLPEIASGGTGAILIHRPVLEHPAMRWPFKDVFDEDGVRIRGHDLEFCHRAKKAGFKVVTAMNHSCEHYATIDLRQVRALLSSWENQKDTALRIAKQATDKLAEYIEANTDERGDRPGAE